MRESMPKFWKFILLKGGHVMGERKKVMSTCLGCIGNCGMIYEVEDDRIVKIQGNPESQLTKGHVCPKGLAIETLRSSHERLKKPLKRKGERGEGKWAEISWDEALFYTADRLAQVKQEYGPEAFVVSIGFAGVLAGLDPDIGRFLHCFGSPNRLVTLHD
jgi:anaerobic selenocysteine-containing dehydrogenase